MKWEIIRTLIIGISSLSFLGNLVTNSDSIKNQTNNFKIKKLAKSMNNNMISKSSLGVFIKYE